jgi:hypothetical protein
MNIFERQTKEMLIPPGFHAVTIPVDARASASLNWEQAIQEAEFFASSGFQLVFDLDLGLFSNLSHPLSHQAQFAALKLSIDHFSTTLLERFGHLCAGIILVKDLLPLKHDAKTTSEYLALLVDQLPSDLSVFALYDAKNTSPAAFALYTRKDFYERVTLAVRSSPFPLYGAVWEDDHPADISIGRTHVHKKAVQPEYGVVLLDEPDDASKEELEKILTQLLESNRSFKIIPELRLAAEWDELHTLYIPKQKLSEQGMRMLQGFIAAGGNVETV